MAMFANNLSTLRCGSSRNLDDRMDTQSFVVQWLPTTGGFQVEQLPRLQHARKLSATRIGVTTLTASRKGGGPTGDRRHRERPDWVDNEERHLHAEFYGPGVTI